MILAFVLILALGSIEHATGTCGECSTKSRAKCLSRMTFKVCIESAKEGGPLEEDTASGIIKCPKGKYCSENEAICLATGPVDCKNKCGKCNAKKVFACVSENEYAFCFGETTPSAGFIGKCSDGKHCNVDQKEGYCADTGTGIATCSGGQSQFPTTVSPTTPTIASTASTSSTPTTPPTSSLTEYCKTHPTARYPVPGNCNEYIYCYSDNGSMVGKQYRCPHPNVFNPNLQRCVLASAYPCSANI